MADKKKECVFYAGILAVSLLIFTLAGERGYYEYPDSWQYIDLVNGQGIMPTYPLFIHLHRVLLGEKNFLYGVVASQTAVTVICLMLYLFWIRKRFHAGYLVSALIFAVSLVPFTLDFPALMGNHAILTEALAYPLFYLFAVVFTETVIRKKYGWVFLTALMGLMMALIRTQMQICFGFAAAAFLYVAWKRGAGKKAWRRTGRLMAALVVCVGIVAAGEICLLQVNGWLQGIAAECRAGLESTVRIERQAAEVASAGTGIPGSVQITAAPGKEKKGIGNGGNVTGQFDSILYDRAFYEMDAEDIELFDSQETREVFQYLFEAADRYEARYVYARDGLWKWKDIMNGTAGGVYTVIEGGKSYRQENPGTDSGQVWERACKEIAIALVKRHWLRMLYHTLCMLPQGFICTVFFQKEAIYGLCHLYTLLVYCAAIALLAVGRKKKAVPQERCEFMLSSLFLNISMVVVVSVIFFGMQRYLIYGFGLFYAALLLMLEQFYQTYGRALWKKARNRS